MRHHGTTADAVSGWSIRFPTIHITFKVLGLKDVPMTLTQARALRNNLDSAIQRFEEMYPDAVKRGAAA